MHIFYVFSEQDMKYVSSASSSPQYRDNLSYDIEEVTEENEDDGNDNSLNVAPSQFPFLSLGAILSGAGNNNATANLYKNIRLASQTSTSLVSNQNQQRSRNLKYANSSSKPPALIRVQDNVALHTNPMKRLLNNNSNVTISKVTHSANLMKPVRTPPTKHKIGLAKCRLIVQTLENQLKVAKTRLAEQLEVPYQVVHG